MMLSSVLVLCVFVGATGAYNAYVALVVRRRPGLLIEELFTIEDVLRFVRERSSDVIDTDEVVSKIQAECIEGGLREGAVIRVSHMHVRYGSDLGVRGYAINLLWSSMLGALESSRVVLLLE